MPVSGKIVLTILFVALGLTWIWLTELIFATTLPTDITIDVYMPSNSILVEEIVGFDTEVSDQRYFDDNPTGEPVYVAITGKYNSGDQNWYEIRFLRNNAETGLGELAVARYDLPQGFNEFHVFEYNALFDNEIGQITYSYTGSVYWWIWLWWMILPWLLALLIFLLRK